MTSPHTPPPRGPQLHPAAVLAIGALALGGILWAAVEIAGPQIEARVRLHAQEALQTIDEPGLEVLVDGRDATLTGAASTTADRDRALDVVGGATGVRSVQDGGVQILGTRYPYGSAPMTPAPEPEPDAVLAPEPPIAIATPPSPKRSTAVVARRAPRPPERAPCAQFVHELNGALLPFADGSAALRGEAVNRLDHLRRALDTCPTLVAGLRGHAHDRGTTMQRFALSQQRAHNAGEWLHAKGIADNRMSVSWAGDRDPATQRGRNRNHAVQVRLVDGGTR